MRRPIVATKEADIILQEAFGNWTHPRLDTLVATGQAISAIFEDEDLLQPIPAALPGPMNVSIANGTVFLLNGTQPVVDPGGWSTVLNISMGRQTMDIGQGRINVTVPVHLRLTQAQYAFINRQEGLLLDLALVLDSNGVVARAAARVTWAALANLATVMGPSELRYAEGDALSRDTHIDGLVVRDPDLQRATGANYTLGLEVRNRSDGRVINLLEWVTGGFHVEDVMRRSATNISYALRGTRTTGLLTDADVAGSPYRVFWNVTDHQAGQLAGDFALRVMNVNDPLRVVCDADNATDDCGYRAARYAISVLNPAAIGSDFVDSTEVMHVLFADDDLLAGLAPLALVANFTDANPADELDLNRTNFEVDANNVSVQRLGGTNRISVTFPVRLRLSPEQFASINASINASGVSLAFNFTLADPGGTGTVSANGSIELLPDEDGDGVADPLDNCPVLNSPDQRDDDGDGIGNPCEAQPVMGLRAVVHSPNVVNLSWTNPRASVLQLLNISDRSVPEQLNRTAINITAAEDLAADAQVMHQVGDLVGLTTYTFTVSGLDLRHGRRNQTLPAATISIATPVDPADEDGDGFANAADNCPFLRSQDQTDDDNDGIGNLCEAEGVVDLGAQVAGETAVDLNWTNPADSELLMLNITYGPTDDTTNRSIVIITTAMDLAAGASVLRTLEVVPDIWYDFMVRGLDARHGVRNQTLPPMFVRFRTRSSLDADGVADDDDNCLFDFNPDQADLDGDTYGDVCGPDRDGDGLREIYTPAQLDAVRNNLTAHYELVGDIDLIGYGNWNPIGTFRGVLDGNGYTIANLTITRTGNVLSGEVGLFSEAASGASIRNLTLRVRNIRVAGQFGVSTYHVGGLIGNSHSASIRDVAVIVEGSISTSLASDQRVGGIIGRGTVDMRTSYVAVRGEISASAFRRSSAGGLIGRLNSGTVQNSYMLVLSGGALRSIVNPGFGTKFDSHAGGLVGRNDGPSPSNSYAVINGTISSSSPRTAYLGGLIARGSATNSYFAAPGSVGGSGTKRTLPQLKCPTAASGTCAGATTYTSWDNATIWDFGDNQTLPDLRSNRRPAYINELLP